MSRSWHLEGRWDEEDKFFLGLPFLGITPEDSWFILLHFGGIWTDIA
jgi:hypothetical protein